MLNLVRAIRITHVAYSEGFFERMPEFEEALEI